MVAQSLAVRHRMMAAITIQALLSRSLPVIAVTAWSIRRPHHMLSLWEARRSISKTITRTTARVPGLTEAAGAALMRMPTHGRHQSQIGARQVAVPSEE